MQPRSHPVIGKVLGQILVDKNIISKDQLDLALRQQKSENWKYLGQILFEIGVPQDKINKVLDLYNKRKRLGEILVDLKVITEDQLAEALERQKELPKKGGRKLLGTLLVELGYTTSEIYLQALSQHLNIPLVSLDDFVPVPSLQKLVGEKYALENKIIVLENTSQKMKVALAEPTVYLMEELQRVLPVGKTMEFYLADPSQVEECFRKRDDPFSHSKYL